jgi:transposase InsO family protein
LTSGTSSARTTGDVVPKDEVKAPAFGPTLFLKLVAEQRRFGYRRPHVLVRGEESIVNRKKTQRLYREEGLTLLQRRGRKRAISVRAPLLMEARPNARWSVDFVHDQLVSGGRLRIVNVVDDVAKECLAGVCRVKQAQATCPS